MTLLDEHAVIGAELSASAGPTESQNAPKFYVDFKETAEGQYLNMLHAIKNAGTFKGDRTGTGTQDLFGYQLRMDLKDGFPLLTTKKMFTLGIFEELLWIMRGETNIKSLTDKNVHIWDQWADKKGDLGPVYGAQWRNAGATRKHRCQERPRPANWRELSDYVYDNDGVDQLQNALDLIRNNPWSRRIIVDSWNPQDLGDMALTPCHCMFQFSVRPDEDDITKPKYLDCMMTQRSSDVFLGVPFNIASYALLTHIMAGLAGLEAGTFVHSFGSVHIYNNHRDQVDEQLTRTPFPLPTLNIKTFDVQPRGQERSLPIAWSIDEFLGYCKGAEDFEIVGYEHHPKIKAEVSV